MKKLLAIGLIFLASCDEANYPTEADARANRERLRLVPIQTEGIKPLPLEEPPAPPKETPTVNVRLQTIGEMDCPHCGQKINIRVEK